MKKRILSLFLTALMVVGFTACKKNDGLSSASTAPKDIIEEVKQAFVNPLTGEETDEQTVYSKPVAIMINNIETAWGVQSSISKADIIYETYVEGGITRLMAVFKDIRVVGKKELGSLRSGRYSYVDLALGHGAQYVHAGLDEKYCKPHLVEVGTKSVDLNSGANTEASIGGGSCAYRVNNGLAIEHTLYTTGKKLYSFLSKNVKMKLDKPQDNWMNFTKDAYTPLGGKCESLYVPFSGSYSAEFKYNASSSCYDKYRYGEKQKDYADGKVVSFKNVLVLYSTVTSFPDNKHMKTHLESGEGYYVTNGAYQKIKWSKGNANDPIKITDEEGKDVNYNIGKTYVCFTSNDRKSSTQIK